VPHHAVELIAVQDQQPASVGGDVQRMILDDDATEVAWREIAEVFVVVAGDVDDAGALAGLAQELLDDVVVRLLPIPCPPEAPAVENVSHQVEEIGLCLPEEIEQEFGIASPRPQMDVGDPDGTVPSGQGSDGVQWTSRSLRLGSTNICWRRLVKIGSFYITPGDI
jgi:hypothetical protein